MKGKKAAMVAVSMLMIGGCATVDEQVKQSPVPAVEDNYLELLISDNKGKLERKKRSRETKLTRVQQIDVAVEAAVTDKVRPLLMMQPRERSVFFKFSNHAVESKWNNLLRRHVDYMSSDLSIRLLVAGFTDEKGSAKFNFKLGQKRADNVCAELLKLGARAEQLTCVSYGETHPADPGSDDESRARNRRVELLY